MFKALKTFEMFEIQNSQKFVWIFNNTKFSLYSKEFYQSTKRVDLHTLNSHVIDVNKLIQSCLRIISRLPFELPICPQFNVILFHAFMFWILTIWTLSWIHS